MQILMTGASGLIGSHLEPLLKSDGHSVIRLVRGNPQTSEEHSWDSDAESLDPQLLDGCDVLIHLAGESIASGRWTAEKKKAIRDSRVRTTRAFAEAIAERNEPMKSFIVASAIGYYGDRGEEILSEESEPGVGFLSDVCQAWEAAAEPARDRTRVVHVRTGVVLSKDGGALAKMLTPFRMGVGGVIGSGRQFWSWISIADIARLYQFAVSHESLSGPVNGTAPQPVTNRDFTKTLGSVIHRPTLLPLPKIAAHIALGEMANDLLLSSARVLPMSAEEHGFIFEHPSLENALSAELK